MSNLLELKEVTCCYDGSPVVRQLSMSVKQAGLYCLLGPSGCGKTTVLRAIAGFEPLTQGEILLRGAAISKPGYQLPPNERHLGMVFQDYALFPHMSVEENICFGMRSVKRQGRRDTAHQLLESVGLKGYAKRFPHELSGGQQQRVALARALAIKPEIILMDEPFSNLDIDLRERLGLEVKEILKAQGIAAILVTHDQHEAFALGEMVGIMREGRIEQWDTPFNLYHEPRNRFVANFIGQGVFLKGSMLSQDEVDTEIGVIKGDRAYPCSLGSAVEVLLRPDDILPEPDSLLKAEVTNKAFKGAEILYTLKLATGSTVLSLFPSHHDHYIGERVGIRIAIQHLIVFG
ncbi:MAG: ABC transporter ATP-binding protein [Gammaproteobacteria bacterium]|nr:ABC transporter ATP-binding protein [Gammaproteobacteria bacterium]